jgi:hypothetical protein
VGKAARLVEQEAFVVMGGVVGQMGAGRPTARQWSTGKFTHCLAESQLAVSAVTGPDIVPTVRTTALRQLFNTFEDRHRRLVQVCAKS